jgi:Tfp pilus assembly protein PilF
VPAAEPAPKPAAEPAADKSMAQGYFVAGTEAMDAGRFDEAVEKYLAAIQADPELVDAYINLGNIYFFEHQDAARARGMYEAALKLDPENALVHNNIGVSFLRDGDLNAAETHLSAAVELDPEYVDGWYNMACLAARREQESLAMDRLVKAGRHCPDVAIWAAGDEDLRNLRDMPDFREFIGQSSREQ